MSARYEAAKRIVANSQHEEVEGMILDLFTASALVAVYEAMNETNQARFDTVAFGPLANFCLQKVSA